MEAHRKLMYLTALLLICCAINTRCDEILTRHEEEPHRSPSPFKPSTEKKTKVDKKKLIEKQFFKLIGITPRPNNVTKRRVKVPDHMWKLYHKWSDESHRKGADTVRLLYQHDTNTSGGKGLRFNITKIPKEEVIHSADLLLFNEKRRNRKRNKIIHLYKAYLGNSRRLFAYMKKVRNNKKGYVKIDITDLIEDWRTNGIENASILVEVSRNGNDENSVHIRKRRYVSQSEWEMKQPLLFVYTSDKSRQKIKATRTRRNIPVVFHNSQINFHLNKTHQISRLQNCGLRQYFLNFTDLSWNEWIIAPNGYKINFCSGECPHELSDHHNTNNHAVIQNLAHRLNPLRAPPICCIPTKLKDLTLMYLDNMNQLVLKTPEKMTATECGCR